MAGHGRSAGATGTGAARGGRARPRLLVPVVLVGLMGAGKTSVGTRLADALGVPFHDSDDAVETAAGMTVAEIFERFGETHFRDGERRVIARLLSSRPMVLATGGGAFLNGETRAAIAEIGRAHV